MEFFMSVSTKGYIVSNDDKLRIAETLKKRLESLLGKGKVILCGIFHDANGGVLAIDVESMENIEMESDVQDSVIIDENSFLNPNIFEIFKIAGKMTEVEKV